MIDEKLCTDFKNACKALAESEHNICAFVLERDFQKVETFESIRVINGSVKDLYCVLQLLADTFFEILSGVDEPKDVELFMKMAVARGIEKAKEKDRQRGTADGQKGE